MSTAKNLQVARAEVKERFVPDVFYGCTEIMVKDGQVFNVFLFDCDGVTREFAFPKVDPVFMNAMFNGVDIDKCTPVNASGS